MLCRVCFSFRISTNCFPIESTIDIPVVAHFFPFACGVPIWLLSRSLYCKWMNFKVILALTHYGFPLDLLLFCSITRFILCFLIRCWLLAFYFILIPCQRVLMSVGRRTFRVRVACRTALHLSLSSFDWDCGNSILWVLIFLSITVDGATRNLYEVIFIIPQYMWPRSAAATEKKFSVCCFARNRTTLVSPIA